MDTKVTEKGGNFQAVNGIREVAGKFQGGVKLGELMTKNSFCYTSQILISLCQNTRYFTYERFHCMRKHHLLKMQITQGVKLRTVSHSHSAHMSCTRTSRNVCQRNTIKSEWQGS